MLKIGGNMGGFIVGVYGVLSPPDGVERSCSSLFWLIGDAMEAPALTTPKHDNFTYSSNFRTRTFTERSIRASFPSMARTLGCKNTSQVANQIVFSYFLTGVTHISCLVRSRVETRGTVGKFLHVMPYDESLQSPAVPCLVATGECSSCLAAYR